MHIDRVLSETARRKNSTRVGQGEQRRDLKEQAHSSHPPTRAEQEDGELQGGVKKVKNRLRHAALETDSG